MQESSAIQKYDAYQAQFFSRRPSVSFDEDPVLFQVALHKDFSKIDDALLRLRDGHHRFIGHYIALLHGLQGFVELKFYLKHFGASFWYQLDCDGMTPMHYAVFSPDNRPVCDFVRDDKLDLQAKNRVGHSVVDLADLYNRELLLALQSITFDFSLKINKMFVCAKQGNLSYIKELLSASRHNALMIHYPGQGGRTLLHVALQYGWSHIVDYLLSIPVNVNALDLQGNGPLHYAVLYSHQAKQRLPEMPIDQDLMMRCLKEYDSESAQYIIENGLYAVARLLQDQADRVYRNHPLDGDVGAGRRPYDMGDGVNQAAILVQYEEIRFQQQYGVFDEACDGCEQAVAFWTKKYWCTTLAQMPQDLALTFLDELSKERKMVCANKDFDFPPVPGLSFQEHYAKLAVRSVIHEVEDCYPRAEAFSNPSADLQEALDQLREDLVDELKRLRYVKFGTRFEPRELGPDDSASDNTPIRLLKSSFSSEPYTCLMQDIFHAPSTGVFARAKMILLRFQCLPNKGFLPLFGHIEQMVRQCMASEQPLLEHENYTKRRLY